MPPERLPTQQILNNYFAVLVNAHRTASSKVVGMCIDTQNFQISLSCCLKKHLHRGNRRDWDISSISNKSVIEEGFGEKAVDEDVVLSWTTKSGNSRRTLIAQSNALFLRLR